MYGFFAGTLYMETSDAGGQWVEQWSRSGNQGKQWHYALVDLRSSPSLVEKLRFRIRWMTCKMSFVLNAEKT